MPPSFDGSMIARPEETAASAFHALYHGTPTIDRVRRRSIKHEWAISSEFSYPADRFESLAFHEVRKLWEEDDHEFQIDLAMNLISGNRAGARADGAG